RMRGWALEAPSVIPAEREAREPGPMNHDFLLRAPTVFRGGPGSRPSAAPGMTRVMSAIILFHGPTAPETRKQAPEPEECAHGAEWLVQNLDLLRGRLARGQCADHGAAHARGVACLLCVRRRTRLRGRCARRRSALRTHQRLSAQARTEGARFCRHLDGAGRRR